jgi:hypothetical protein
MFKQSVVWNKVTEVLPEAGREYLVWTGRGMLVSDADFYDEEYLSNIPASMIEDYKKSVGYFQEFGHKYYFDDEKVHWSELPLAPGEENPSQPDPMDGMVSRDAYLTKDGTIIGIHAIGYPEPYEWTEVALDGTETQKTSDFMQMEIWGNEYDENHQMLGRGSFRVFDQFESEVKNWEADGWVRREGPKKKEVT